MSLLTHRHQGFVRFTKAGTAQIAADALAATPVSITTLSGTGAPVGMMPRKEMGASRSSAPASP
jgi:hypothetical protein